MHVNLLRTVAACFIAALVLAAIRPAQAQPEGQARVAVRGDSAFVYHTAEMPLDNGFHVERSTGGGDFERITEEPVRAAQDPRALPARLGERYDAIKRNLEAEGPDAVFFRLRADRQMGLFLAFAYPEVARVMGRLFVDSEAPIGESVTYRLVFVDGLGQPTGRTLEREVDPLREVSAPDPREVELSNEGAQVRIEWQYPTPPSGGRGDQVLRFEVLRRDRATGNFVPVSTERTLLRNEAQEDFFYLFNAGGTGRTETFVVAAVQMTGRRIESEPVEFFIEDNVPPDPVSNVEVFMTPDAKVEVNWPVSPEPDVAGYRLTRARSLTDEFNALNDDLLGPLETTYVDSTTKGRRNYYYKVTVVDSSDNAAKPSNAAMARVEDDAPPPAPAAFEAEPQDDGTVELTWQADVPADLHTYEVMYQRTDVNPGDTWAHANEDILQEAAYTARGIEGRGFAEGAVYRFGVAMSDSSHNRSDTAFAKVKIPDRTPPEPPSRVQVRDDGGVRALVRWNRSSSPDVTAYRVFRREDAEGAPDTVIARTERLELQVQDDEAKTGQPYVYAVSAVDSLGNEGSRSEPTRFVLRDRDAPPAVRNVQAVAREQGVTLTWEAVASEDVQGYRLYQSDLPTGVFEPVNDQLLTETRFVHTGGETESYYRVYAVDRAGNASRPSQPARAQEPRP